MADSWGALRAGLLALLVAGLIWIWAEGESLSSQSLPRVVVSLPTEPTGDLVFIPDDPAWNGVVQVRLEGSVHAVEAAQGVLSMATRLPAALDGMPREPGPRQAVDFREALRSLPEMASLRAVVAEVEPARLPVRVVRMVSREVPVRVELGAEVAVDGEAVPSPATVRVRLPEAAAAGLGDAAQAVATVPDEAVARLRGDGAQTVTATVRLPGPMAEPELIGFTPETVTVSLRLKRAVDSVRLPNVPVWFSLPPTEDGAKWNVEVLDKFLADVAVTGPTEDVRRVQSGVVAIKAVVELSSDDLEKAAQEKGEMVKQSRFVGVPAGVSCTVANGAVRVRVVRRGAGG